MNSYSIFSELGNYSVVPISLIIIIIDNFCIALFSGVPKLTALNRVGEPRTTTSSFTQLLRFEEVLQVNMVLNVHRNHKAY